jgi:hypothetical protein
MKKKSAIMIPATGPRSAAYPMSQTKMYPSPDTSFQGITAVPSAAVTKPALLKEIFFGNAFKSALAGATTLAAMFVERVAMMSPDMAITVIKGPLFMRDNNAMGSLTAAPKITAEQLVTASATKENAAMKNGRPIA